MKRYEFVFDENVSEGINAVSLVTKPATGEKFIAFNEDEKVVQLSEINKEERILLGLVLAPNQPVYRNQDGEEFTVQASADTIKKLAYSFQKNKNQSNSNLQHDGKNLNGVTIVETWTVEDSKVDKSVLYGLEYPKGSWLAMMKIDNDDVWNDYVKKGIVRGFSVEGMVRFKEIESNINFNKIEMSEMDSLIDSFTKNFKVFFAKNKLNEAEEVEAEDKVEETEVKEVEEIKAEGAKEEAEAVEEPAKVEMSEDEVLKFSEAVAVQVKEQVEKVKVEFSETVKGLEKDLKDAKDEIVKLQEQPVGKAIKSQPTQSRPLTNLERYKLNNE